MKLNELKNKLLSGGLDEFFTRELAVEDSRLDAERERCSSLLDLFGEKYGEGGEVHLFSVGGRTEISGNHTDHNLGRVIAASVNLDVLAVARAREDGVIRIFSRGFGEDFVNVSEAMQPRADKYFTSEAICAGMVRAFSDAGYAYGGFDACTVSSVLTGSGLSSSAAYEVSVGNILSHLYNDGKVPNVEIAKMAQFAENEYFGKPCGLMDQMACALGGFITIDFEKKGSPRVEKLNFDPASAGLSLCIVNTRASHADLNVEYAAIPAEMKSVAAYLGADVLRGSDKGALMAAISKNAAEMRENLGDRSIMRAIHFFNENERVAKQVDALRSGDTTRFLAFVNDSGNSSYKYLQNIYTAHNSKEQAMSLALCLSDDFIRSSGISDRAACRVHGGGFAGTVQAFIPTELCAEYASMMDSVFGSGACHVLSVRKSGATKIC